MNCEFIVNPFINSGLLCSPAFKTKLRDPVPSRNRGRAIRLGRLGASAGSQDACFAPLRTGKVLTGDEHRASSNGQAVAAGEAEAARMLSRCLRGRPRLVRHGAGIRKACEHGGVTSGHIGCPAVAYCSIAKRMKSSAACARLGVARGWSQSTSVSFRVSVRRDGTETGPVPPADSRHCH